MSATLEVNPILQNGPNALTEVVLHGEYDPPDVRHRGTAEFFLERRVVNAALHVFLDGLVSSLEELVPEP